VDLGKALVTLFLVQQIHSNCKASCQIDRGDIQVPQNIIKFFYTKYVGDKKIEFFENFLFMCVTRPYLSGVPLLYCSDIKLPQPCKVVCSEDDDP